MWRTGENFRWSKEAAILRRQEGVGNYPIYYFLALFSSCLNNLKGIRRWVWKRNKAEEVIKGSGKSSIKKDKIFTMLDIISGD